jgi:hypothetical protein
LGKETSTHDPSILILQIASLNQDYFSRIARETHRRSHRLLLACTHIVITLILVFSHNIEIGQIGLDPHYSHHTELQVAELATSGGESKRINERGREGVVYGD